jgi:hypothetical protein
MTYQNRSYMKNFIRFLPACLVVTSCMKTQPVSTKQLPDVHITFSTVDLDYVKLPLNRYFIYKDSATGNIDSVKVTRSTISENYGPAVPSLSLPAVYSQKYYLTLSNISDSGKAWFQGRAWSVDASAGGSYGSDPMAGVRFFARDNLINNPDIPEDDNVNYAQLEDGYGFSSEPGINSGNQYLPSFEVDKHTFYDVIVDTAFTHGDSTQFSGFFKSTYWWAKGIGVIKRTVEKDSVIKTALLERYSD